MATAKRLPSGSYRVRVFSHTDENGKKHQVSFTAPTKREAEMQAAEWAAKKDRRKKHNLSVSEAIDGYISAKQNVLSPSTVREYKRMQRTRYAPLNNKLIKKLTSEDMQLFISSLAKEISAKSVKNTYGLLLAAITFYDPDARFKVNLPKSAKRKEYSPSDEDIQSLVRDAKEELKKCIALSAFGSLRRSEVCALKYGDIDKNMVYIHAGMVQDENYQWIYKEYPKTDESVRYAFLPAEIIELLGTGKKDDFIIKLNPNALTQAFTKLRDQHNLSIRFHDLRHYYASIGAVLGVPDFYLAKMGGWSPSSSVMKNIYQNRIKDIENLYASKMSDHFKKMLE